jgi:16S rRNA C967 or C1407 C5-methylase (RsmB/RsmF family)/NOL1/NOP2/fmu family ribosome biogenesis protein
MPVDQLPQAFTERISHQLGDEYPSFLEALSVAPPIGVRRNPLKPASLFPDASPIAWCPEGMILSERPVFALDPLWHAGAYYVQEPSSMLVDFALRSYYKGGASDKILDLCAAPGGKTTLLAANAPFTSLIIANEVIRKRYSVLRENIARWGDERIQCTNHDPKDFVSLAGEFNLVLVDAPCSGEGLFRKDREAIQEWSPENAVNCAHRQSGILAIAASLVATDGLLIYCTCTFNPEENDDQIAPLLISGDWENLQLDTPEEWGMIATTYGVQCWPHRVEGEGFYLAVLRRKTPAPRIESQAGKGLTDYRAATSREKELIHPYLTPLFTGDVVVRLSDGAIFTNPLRELDNITNALPRMSFGIRIGEIKGKDFIPAHELALSTLVHADTDSLDLSFEEALRYLRRDALSAPDGIRHGWTLMHYQGLAMGWAKTMPGRINNYLPMELRLRLRD